MTKNPKRKYEKLRMEILELEVESTILAASVLIETETDIEVDGLKDGNTFDGEHKDFEIGF